MSHPTFQEDEVPEEMLSEKEREKEELVLVPLVGNGIPYTVDSNISQIWNFYQPKLNPPCAYLVFPKTEDYVKFRMNLSQDRKILTLFAKFEFFFQMHK